MTEQKNVPRLRFTGFDEQWVLNKTKITILAGNAYKLDEYIDSGYLLIQGLHIQPGRIVLEDKPKYIEKNIGTHVKITNGDIVLGLNRPITNNQLKVSRFYLDKESVLYQRAGKLLFDTSKLDTEFIYQYLRCQTFMRQLNLELIGSDQPYIRSNLFQATKNVFSSFVEQQKIASFLSKVDEKISLLSEKKAKLTEYKKGAMQKLFDGKWQSCEHSQNGKLVFIPPTLRFKADDGSEFGEWGRENLIDIAAEKLSNGVFNDPKKIGSGYRLINVKDMYLNNSIDISELTLLNLSEAEFEKNKVKYGDIFFTRSSLVPSGIAYSNVNLSHEINLTYDGHLIKLSPKLDMIFPIFIANYMRSTGFRKNVISRGKQSTMTTIGQDDIRDIKLPLPTIEEQTKIANFLSAIDKKIDLTISELEKAKEWKRGLLQQLFV